MTEFFGILGDGRTMRTFALVATFVSLGAIAIGAEANRYALTGRPSLLASFLPQPQGSGIEGPRVNVIDYATTGSVQSKGQHEFIVLGPCGAATDPH
jgi:hypothetical protein